MIPALHVFESVVSFSRLALQGIDSTIITAKQLS